MRLYGTTTSPFVRRVRVFAAEVGEPVELVNTADDEGQAELRRRSPIWKVPIAEVGGRTLFDSRVIIDWLVATRGFGGMTPPRDRWREQNLVNAIDGALDSTVQLFYLRRENAPIDGLPFTIKQVNRTAAVLDWLGHELDGKDSFGDGFGLPELSLCCALDWMDFRQSYPTAQHPSLALLRAAWAERPSMVATRPHA